jgi:hypothetical protein
VDRIHALPASRDAKRSMLAGKAIPQATFGSSVVLVGRTVAEGLARKCLRAAWGKSFALRPPSSCRRRCLTL